MFFARGLKMRATNPKTYVLMSVLLVGALCISAVGKTIYVDDDGPADFNNIQAGIDASVDGDTVLVAPGTYTGEGNRDIDFKGKAITVKSEEGPQTCIIDCQGSKDEQHRGFYFHNSEDSNSIVEGFTITKGFVDTGGGIYCYESSPTIRDCTIKTNSVFRDRRGGDGGGIYCGYSNATFIRCRIIANTAMAGWSHASYGLGGAILSHGGSPSILHCEVYDNVVQGSDDRTGAIDIMSSEAKVRINNCKISTNYSHGLHILNSQVEVTGCIVTGNRRDGISCSDSSTVIEKCKISSNQQSGIRSLGGDVVVSHCLIAGNSRGIWCHYRVEQTNLLTARNCTITDNFPYSLYSGEAYGIYCEGYSCGINNCIIWGNRGWRNLPLENQIRLGSIGRPSSCTILYSNVQGGKEAIRVSGEYVVNWDNSSISTDPCFAKPGYLDPNGTSDDFYDDFLIEGDYHLKSQAGRWNPNSQRWIQDEVTSPCIDAGDPNSLIGHEPFPNDGIINMGAYGGTIEASKSYFGWPVCETIIAGDINGDCKVDFKDFAIMAAHWLEKR